MINWIFGRKGFNGSGTGTGSGYGYGCSNTYGSSGSFHGRGEGCAMQFTHDYNEAGYSWKCGSGDISWWEFKK